MILEHFLHNQLSKKTKQRNEEQVDITINSNFMEFVSHGSLNTV